MILLAGFLEVLLRAGVLAGLALALGGIAFAAAVQAPLRHRLPIASRRRTLSGIAAGGAVVLACQGAVLLLEPWALADPLGRWPLREFLETGFARAAAIRGALGGVVALLALRARGQVARAPARPRGGLVVAGVLLAASGAPLAHAVGRLRGAGPLMALTVLHQAAAAVWWGGLAHLLAERWLGRREPRAALAWSAEVARFSPLAASAVAVAVGTGVALATAYAGSVGALVGTAYGAMILTKIGLLGAALALAAGNRAAVRRWRARGARAAPERGLAARVEAEAGTVLAILLAAAALTSQPPAVDVADRAAPGEVAAAFAPKRPQLAPPPWREMVAASPSSLDPYARPGPLDRAQSNFNHNVAGLLVLLTALGALLDRTGRLPAARHWPVGFLALAAFLLAIAEPNGWPFGPEPFFASLRAPSVLVHRLATLLVGALALLEWRVRTDPRPRRGRLAFPLLCGLGGVLLLTHSHSVLAARWAFLTELSHDAIGLIAVLMGIDRWLEVRPGGGRRGWGWAMGMALVGLVLLFYREA